MAFNEETEITLLKQRVSLLEEALNQTIEALNNAVSRKAFQEMLLLRQKELEVLTGRVTALENQIAILEQEVHE